MFRCWNYNFPDNTTRLAAYIGGQSSTSLAAPSSGMDGERCMRFGGSSAFGEHLLGASFSSGTIGWKFRCELGSLSQNRCIDIMTGTTVQCSVRINTDGTVQALTGTSGLIGAAAGAVSVSNDFDLETEVTIGNSGSLKFWINGSLILNLSNVDTQAHTSTTTFDRFRLRYDNATFVNQSYVNTATGYAPKRPWEVKRTTLTGDSSAENAWPTPASNKWQTVDEAVWSASDSIASATTSLPRRQGFTHSGTSRTTIYGVSVVGWLMNATADAASGLTYIKSGGTRFEGSSVSTSDGIHVPAYRDDLVNPNGGAAWSESAVDATECGVSHTSSDGLEAPTCAWIGMFVFASTADTTAPTLTNPTAQATGGTTADGTVDTNEANGTLYGVVTTSSTAPSKAQVKAGQDHTGAAAAFADDQAIASTGTKTFNATGLASETTYWFHFMHEDAAANQSDVVSSASFTTDDVTAGPPRTAGPGPGMGLGTGYD